MEEIVERIKEKILSLLEEEKFDLVEINYFYSGGKKTLRLLVDRPKGGITLSDCASLNERIGRILDDLEIMKEGYVLEVSSPGVDRPLKTKNDFLRVKGRNIRVFLSEPEKGKKEFSGILKDVDDEFIFLEVKDEIIKISFEKVVSAKQLI